MNKERNQSARKFFPLILSLTLLITAFIFGLHKIDDFDFLWHLKTGEIILKQGPPQLDPYSFRLEGKQWIDSQWLFQAIIYLVYRGFGFKGLSLFLAFLATVLYLLLYWLIWDRKLYPLGFFFCMLSIWPMSIRFHLRPEFFSYLLIVIYLTIMERARQRSHWLIFLLPFFQLLWANLEGLWPVGLFIIGAYFAEDFIFNLASRSKPTSSRDSAGLRRLDRLAGLLEPDYQSQPGRIFAVLIICIIVSFLTPYTMRGFLFPFTLLLEVAHPSNLVKSHILDSLSVFPAYFKFPFIAVPLLILIFVSALSFFLNRKPRPAHWIIWPAFLFISLSARRNIPFICLLSVPVMAINFKSYLYSKFFSPDSGERPALKIFPFRLKFFSSRHILFLQTLPCASAIGLSILFIITNITGQFHEWNKSLREFGTGFKFDYYPVAACGFLKELSWKGRIFNHMNIGGYLIWAGYPDWKIYMDSRLEVYGNDGMVRYFLAFTDQGVFQEEEKKYGFEAIVISTHPRMIVPLLRNLSSDPSWVLVYADPAALIYLKDSPDQHHLVERYRLKP